MNLHLSLPWAGIGKSWGLQGSFPLKENHVKQGMLFIYKSTIFGTQQLQNLRPATHSSKKQAPTPLSISQRIEKFSITPGMPSSSPSNLQHTKCFQTISCALLQSIQEKEHVYNLRKEISEAITKRAFLTTPAIICTLPLHLQHLINQSTNSELTFSSQELQV